MTMKTMTKTNKCSYTNETVDFLFDIIKLKNIVIKEMGVEIKNLRDLVTGRR